MGHVPHVSILLAVTVSYAPDASASSKRELEKATADTICASETGLHSIAEGHECIEFSIPLMSTAALAQRLDKEGGL